MSAQSQQIKFQKYIELFFQQLEESEKTLLPKELIIATVNEDNTTNQSQLMNLLLTKLTSIEMEQLQQRLLKVDSIYKLNSLIEQIYKNKPNNDQTITQQLSNSEDYFLGKFFQLNDPEGKETIYSEIIQVKIYQEENKQMFRFKLENGSQIFLSYKSNTILEVYTQCKIKVKLIDLLNQLSENKKCKIEFYRQKDEFMDYKVNFEYGIYELTLNKIYYLPNGVNFNYQLLKESDNNIYYKFDIQKIKCFNCLNIHKIWFTHQQKQKVEIKEVELKDIYCWQFKEKTHLKSITPNNVSENIQIIQMKLDENQKNLKILEEISQCKDNILRFLKEEINQSLLHSLLDNLALNNCKLSSLEVNSALVMENMNKIKQLSDLLIVEEMQETILKNLVLEASYTNLIKKSKTLQVIKVMDLLKESFDHIKSVNSMDLVFFLGGTGSGKSTSINYYLGHELEEYNRYGRKFLKLKLEKDLPLNEFAKIGHSIAVSETTFVQGYKVARKEKLMLCDCPGFDDTRGDIYDLTTVLSIDQTIKNCNSIKAIVLTLSYESFFVNRSSAIIQLFENVRQLIPNIFNDNQVKNSVYLLITKANNSNQLKEVLTMLIQDAYKTDNQMLNYLEEQDNQYNLKNTKNMERLQIWQFVLYLIQNQRVISYNIINQMEALDQLVDFENMMGIDKNQFCKAMDRSDKKQLAFSKYIIFQLDTWQRQIFEKFFHEIPQEIKNAETWINQKQTSIKEKEKENKLEEERIQYLKTKIAEFENEIQTLQKLSNNKEQIIQKLNTKNKFSDQIRKDAEGEIENLNCYIKKKNGILERNKKEIESFKNEIQNIQNEIKKLEQDNTKLSEGNTYKLLYEFKQLEMNDKLEYWSASNSHENAFHNVSKINQSGELKTVLAGEFSGVLWQLAYIEQEYYIVPKDAKNLYQMCFQDHISTEGQKYRAYIEGEKWAFNLGVKAQPDRKKMVYSIKTIWQKGSTIPWFKISHDLPNMDLNEATILNKLAEIDSKKRTSLGKAEDIKEMEKDNNNLQRQIESKLKEINQNKKIITEVKLQEHISDQISQYKKYINDYKFVIQQAQEYIQSNNKDKISEQEHIGIKQIELSNLKKQTLHYAIIIKCKIEIAHLLREFAEISTNGLGIDVKNIDCHLIPSLDSYSQYYDIYRDKIWDLCEETLKSYKINSNKQ